MDKNTEPNTDKRLDNLKPAWKKGDPSPNPNGRPLGQRNYATIYREALIKLAEANDKSPEDLENEILSKALVSARSGDYRFYKDILDRLYGTATNKSDITSGGDKILQIIQYGDPKPPVQAEGVSDTPTPSV